MRVVRKTKYLKILLIIICFFAFVFAGIAHLNSIHIKLNNSNLNQEDNRERKSNQNQINSYKLPFPKDNINQKVLDSLDGYILEIKSKTATSINSEQRDNLINFLHQEPVYHLSAEIQQIHRKAFDSIRKDLINQWESHYDIKWPKYTENLLQNGKVVRFRGQNYDAHHIIELSWNGPNTWWNLTPAKYGSEHQNGIHGPDTYATKLFSRNSID